MSDYKIRVVDIAFDPNCVKSKAKIRDRCVKKIELFERSEFSIFSTYKEFECFDLANCWLAISTTLIL